MSFRLLRSITVVCLFVINFYGFPVNAAYQAYEVEAVYIFRIANFIQWESKNKTSLVFCGSKDDPVMKTLKIISKDKSIQGKSVAVITNNKSNCDIYVAHKKTTMAELKKLNKNVLTISGKKNFTKQSGMIELRQVDGKVKPAINLDNLQHSSFNVSSQLLRLAIIERGN
ncbi:hypothetical protein A6E02_13885 [Aliivibrio fischeri]|nr:hypothetical protein A6E02_13885 [Aliivibrio fischeri]OED55631.1 hypothetical protein BEI47_02405 [Aliivibrio fischeri]